MLSRLLAPYIDALARPDRQDKKTQRTEDEQEEQDKKAERYPGQAKNEKGPSQMVISTSPLIS